MKSAVNKCFFKVSLIISLILSGCSGDLKNIDLVSKNMSFEQVVVNQRYSDTWGYNENRGSVSDRGEYNVFISYCSESFPQIEVKKYLGMRPSKHNPHVDISMYRYYCVFCSYSMKVTHSLEFMGKGLCAYRENYEMSDCDLYWICTCSDEENDGNVGERYEYNVIEKPWTKSERVFNVLETESSDQYVLYEGDTYIDAYIEGKQIHLIKRIPSVEDMGVFELK